MEPQKQPQEKIPMILQGLQKTQRCRLCYQQNHSTIECPFALDFYHATNKYSLDSILQSGLKPSQGRLGNAVYVSDDPLMCKRYVSTRKSKFPNPILLKLKVLITKEIHSIKQYQGHKLHKASVQELQIQAIKCPYYTNKQTTLYEYALIDPTCFVVSWEYISKHQIQKTLDLDHIINIRKHRQFAETLDDQNIPYQIDQSKINLVDQTIEKYPNVCNLCFMKNHHSANCPFALTLYLIAEKHDLSSMIKHGLHKTNGRFGNAIYMTDSHQKSLIVMRNMKRMIKNPILLTLKVMVDRQIKQMDQYMTKTDLRANEMNGKNYIQGVKFLSHTSSNKDFYQYVFFQTQYHMLQWKQILAKQNEQQSLDQQEHNAVEIVGKMVKHEKKEPQKEQSMKIQEEISQSKQSPENQFEKNVVSNLLIQDDIKNEIAKFLTLMMPIIKLSIEKQNLQENQSPLK